MNLPICRHQRHQRSSPQNQIEDGHPSRKEVGDDRDEEKGDEEPNPHEAHPHQDAYEGIVGSLLPMKNVSYGL